MMTIEVRRRGKTQVGQASEIESTNRVAKVQVRWYTTARGAGNRFNVSREKQCNAQSVQTNLCEEERRGP